MKKGVRGVIRCRGATVHFGSDNERVKRVKRALETDEVDNHIYVKNPDYS